MPPKAKFTPEERKARKYAYTARWRAKNKEKVRASTLRWHALNKERVAKVSKAYYNKHREAKIVQHKEWYMKNIAREREAAKLRAKPNRERDKLRKYGLTPAMFWEIVAKQEDRCKACGDKFGEGKGKRRCVDHCHSTGKVRGILCIQCNLSLGCMKEDPNRIHRLAEYAEKFCLDK